jgi:hypothetical protein
MRETTVNDGGEYLETQVAIRFASHIQRAMKAKRIHFALEYIAIVGSIGLLLLLNVEHVL